MKLPWRKSREQEPEKQPERVEYRIVRPKEDYIQGLLALTAAILVWFFYPTLAVLPFGLALLVGFFMRQTPTNVFNTLEGILYLVGVFGSWGLWYQEIYAGWPPLATQLFVTGCGIFGFLFNYAEYLIGVVVRILQFFSRKPHFQVQKGGK